MTVERTTAAYRKARREYKAQQEKELCLRCGGQVNDLVHTRLVRAPGRDHDFQSAR